MVCELLAPRYVIDPVHETDGTGWGKIAEAVAMWEKTLQRTAPFPVIQEQSETGRISDRWFVSPYFVEWQMGLPEGLVTDDKLGLDMYQQLKILGNGVCPQQAHAAIEHLLDIVEPPQEESPVSDAMPTEEEKQLAESLGMTVQPAPVPNDNPSAHDLAIEIMQQRKAFGLAKYNSLLQADNGRDSARDQVEELADALVYAIIAEAEKKLAQERHDVAVARAWAEGHTQGWKDALDEKELESSNPYALTPPFERENAKHE